MKNKLSLFIFLALVGFIAVNQMAQDYVIDDRLLGAMRILGYDIACLVVPILSFMLLIKLFKRTIRNQTVLFGLQLLLMVVLLGAEYSACIVCYFCGPTRGAPFFAEQSERVGDKFVFNGYRNAIGRVFIADHIMGPIYRVTEICSSRLGKRGIPFEKVDSNHIHCLGTRDGQSLVEI